jgi:hypothetical protein
LRRSTCGTPIKKAYREKTLTAHPAVVDEVIAANPCVLKRGDLLKKKDNDPRWRPSAVFTRSEVEQILWDERIPHDRRVLYALLSLAVQDQRPIRKLRSTVANPGATAGRDAPPP